MLSSLKERCDNSLHEYFCIVGNISGWISSIIWFIVLFPQIIKNYKKKSVEGISILLALFDIYKNCRLKKHAVDEG